MDDRKYYVTQKNANGEYEPVGVLAFQEAVELEYNTKRPVCITPVKDRQ